MNEEEITEIYETLAPMAGDYMNAQAEQIGQAQRSMGPLAANVQGATTSGLGNYTYNRLMRPQADAMRDELLVKGYTNQLNRLLSNSLRDAQERYNNRSTGGTGNGNTAGAASGINQPTTTESTDNTSNGYKHTGVIDEETGLWRDEETGRKSGEVAPVSNPITDFFGWIGDTLSGKGAHRDALKKRAEDSGYVYNDDGNTYWIYYKNKLVESGKL